jgi:hypothetical protein
MHVIYPESNRNNYDRKLVRVVNNPAFYLEVFGSDVNTRIQQSVQVNAERVSETRRRTTPCIYFPIYDSLNLPSVDMFRQSLFGMFPVQILTNTQATPIETFCGLRQTSQKIIRFFTSNISRHILIF